MSASLATWRASLATRRALLAKAEKGLSYWRDRKRKLRPHTPAWHHAGRRILQREAEVEKYRAQVAYAERVVKRHAPLSLAQRAFLVAFGEVGVMESGGNNQGTPLIRYERPNGATGPEPWCGDFVAYCYRKAGSSAVNRSWASVYYLGRLTGVEKVSSTNVRRGDIVRYTFSHTGLFVKWRPDLGPGFFEAIEGNTGASGAVSDSSTGGDGVYRKVRHVSLVEDFRHVTR